MPSPLHKVVYHTAYIIHHWSGVLGSCAKCGEEQIVRTLLVPAPDGKPVPFCQKFARDAGFGSVAWD
jgi:hypothetical protein